MVYNYVNKGKWNGKKKKKEEKEEEVEADVV
jgi:hypothetical protein